MSGEEPPAVRPRVLIASASVGAGHNQAARALEAGLRAAAPDVEIERVDVLDLVPWAFRLYYRRGYAVSVSRLPLAYGVAYWLTDRPHSPRRGVLERRRLWTEGRLLRRFADRARRFQPDVIVNTHFLAVPMFARMALRGELKAPQIVVVTDIEAHRFWYSEGVRHWFVPSPQAAETLVGWGIDPADVTVSGTPVHPKWGSQPDAAAVRAEWRLPSERPVVVLTAGADFTCGPVVRIARALLAAREELHLVVLAGRNKRLLAALAQLAARDERLTPVSFTDRVHELVHVAAVVVTKAGGITTAECLAMAKPMVLLRPVPGQEVRNAAYYSRAGAAVTTRGVDHVAATVVRLLDHPQALAAMGDSAARAYRPATRTIVDAVREMLGA